MVATTPESDMLWAAYRADRSVENRNALVAAYMPSIEGHLSRIRDAGTVQRADVRQWAFEALIAAVETFDARKGATFKTHLSNKVRWAIADGFRAALGRKLPDGTHRGIVACSLQNNVNCWLPVPVRADSIGISDAVEYAMRGLSERQRLIISCRFETGLTIIEIAAMLGVCGQTVINDSQKALEHMRERLCRQEQ